MPSDERVQEAIQALAGARANFRTAVAQAAVDVRALLNRMRPDVDSTALRAAELGAFAEGRIDLARFDALFAQGDMLDAAGVATMERALGKLDDVATWGDNAFHVHVPPGDDLRDTVGRALATMGRAFGAVRTVDLLRSHRYRASEHGSLIERFPPADWHRAERLVAPPLVVEVDGRDLLAGGLAEFMDGAQKLVLLISGAAPPAALVRLVTPGVLVAQVADTASLGALLDGDGPAIVAIMPPTCAFFVMDPRRGNSLSERLSIESIPAGEIRGALGSISAFRQREELAQLKTLAAAAAMPAGAQAEAADTNGRAADHDPVGKLAALLLRQADLPSA